MSWTGLTVEPDALDRAKRRLRRQVIYLAVLTTAAVVGKHYIVAHLEQTAKTMALQEESLKSHPTVEVSRTPAEQEPSQR